MKMLGYATWLVFGQPQVGISNEMLGLIHFYQQRVSRDSSVGTANGYGLDVPWIESRWRRDFPHPPRLALGPTQPPRHWVPVRFPRGKAAGVWY
jgi:hypothetical protein